MTSGLVNASFSLLEWQAVKMIFFAPCGNILSQSTLSMTDTIEPEPTSTAFTSERVVHHLGR